MEYRVLEETSSGDIAKLAACLIDEVIERLGSKRFDVDISKAKSLCNIFMTQGHYTVVGAIDGEKVVGFAALCESHSLYAEGTFGVVQEFYVLPEYRSRSVGSRLLAEVIDVARLKQWVRLELCTPPVPEFDRTVSFYENNGFKITGGYTMKYVIE